MQAWSTREKPVVRRDERGGGGDCESVLVRMHGGVIRNHASADQLVLRRA